MELALIVGTNPRNVKRGPRVRMQAGHWKIRVDGQKDSILTLNCYDLPDKPFKTDAIENGASLILECSTTVETEFVNQGNEASISVFAELL